MTDREYGLYVLRKWYHLSGLDLLSPPVSFDQVVKQIEAPNPTRIAAFGHIILGVNGNKLEAAMRNLAEAYPGEVPHPWSEFGQYVVREVGTLNFNDYEEATLTGLEQAGEVVASVAAIGASLYLLAAGVALVVMFGPQIKSFLASHRGSRA